MFQRRREVRVDGRFLKFVRTLDCLFCGSSPVDAHHFINRAWRESKRDDHTAIPACRECHSMIHSIGLEGTCEKFGMLRFTDLAVAVIDIHVAYQEKCLGIFSDDGHAF